MHLLFLINLERGITDWKLSKPCSFLQVVSREHGLTGFQIMRLLRILVNGIL